MRWNRDIKTEWTTSNTTGGTLWEAAGRLADFLEGSRVVREGDRVLELGAGCGWLGIIVALNNACEVVMTDQEEEGQLDWTQHNIDICGHAVPNCTTAPLDWSIGNPSITSQEWDIIVGCDLVYNEAGVELLPRLLATLLRPRTAFYYSHTRYRYEDSDMTFLRNLKSSGLTCREVWLKGTEPPPTSPAPMTQVFPQKRIVTWRITKGEPREGESENIEVADHSPTDTVVFGDDDSDE